MATASDSSDCPRIPTVATIRSTRTTVPKPSASCVERLRDGLINATGKRSNRIRRAEGAQIADFLPVSARLRGVAWITG
ncbi:hypothetical protein, partial [Xanthomonas vasicola]|uniref:hypothetical protein n=1 Tax=Xanthomonas vasicola TaxID=56459 RepID=UPI001C71AB8D